MGFNSAFKGLKEELGARGEAVGYTAVQSGKLPVYWIFSLTKSFRTHYGPEVKSV